ncbi:Hypothetical predicted protein [Podarcis lilfordi]|uniref:Uncharacterized protein n=1 Tax=Podarcis lilfordi TaxID=74358 RepID=A0AA35KJE4_9SAUR|nr:Hypothetical predicted protein [Podarcis lilfordi]
MLRRLPPPPRKRCIMPISFVGESLHPLDPFDGLLWTFPGYASQAPHPTPCKDPPCNTLGMRNAPCLASPSRVEGGVEGEGDREGEGGENDDDDEEKEGPTSALVSTGSREEASERARRERPVPGTHSLSKRLKFNLTDYLDGFYFSYKSYLSPRATCIRGK